MAETSSNAANRRRKLKEKVGAEVWDRYMTSVKRGLLTQEEAEQAMQVVRKKAVTKKNRERKANGPQPKSNHEKRRERAQRRASEDWSERKHPTGHRVHHRREYPDGNPQ